MDTVRNSSALFENSLREQSQTIMEIIYVKATGKSILEYDVPTLIILFVIFFLGSGNIVVLYVFKKTKKFRTTFNIFVIGLAFENVLSSWIRVPMEIFDILSRYELRNKTWCRIKLFIGGFSNTGTLSLVGLMAFVRMVILLRSATMGISTKIACLIVSISFCIGLGMAFVTIDNNNSQYAICVGDLHSLATNGTSAEDTKARWQIQLTLSIIFFTLTIISYFILIIYLIIKRAQKEIIMKKDRKNNIMTIKTAFLITSVFLISYIGPYVPGMMLKFRASLKDVYHYNSLMVSVAYNQSAANPLVYLYSSSVYRSALRQTIPESLLIFWRKIFQSNRIAPEGSGTQSVFTTSMATSTVWK